MAKSILIILVLTLSFFTSVAFADWAVTVTWTRSTGPNLGYEECRVDGIAKCTVKETEVTKCDFNLQDLTNQKIEIVSFNTQGAENVFVVGTIFNAPEPASNGSIITHWFNPGK